MTKQAARSGSAVVSALGCLGAGGEGPWGETPKGDPGQEHGGDHGWRCRAVGASPAFRGLFHLALRGWITEYNTTRRKVGSGGSFWEGPDHVAPWQSEKRPGINWSQLQPLRPVVALGPLSFASIQNLPIDSFQIKQ